MELNLVYLHVLWHVCGCVGNVHVLYPTACYVYTKGLRLVHQCSLLTVTLRAVLVVLVSQIEYGLN